MAVDYLDQWKGGEKIQYSQYNKRLQDSEERLVRKLTKIILNLEVE